MSSPHSSVAVFARPVVPFLGIVVVAFAATGLRTAGTNWTLVGVAALGSAVLALVTFKLPWSLGATSLFLLPVAADGVLALLRQAQGGSTSGYAPLAILPVAWVGLTQGPRAVAAIVGCTSLLFGLPIVIIGAPQYPATGWRGVVLWTVVATATGIGANRAVNAARNLAVARSRAMRVDRLVETQTAIGEADLSPDDVLTTAAEGAMTLTGADGACIGLLDGGDVVCSAAAGNAIPYLGLRLKAETSITGECVQTRQVLSCTDSEQDSQLARETCQLVGARSLIAVPLLYGGDVKGVLMVWSAAAHDFGGYESQLLASLANTIGAALVRAELIARLTDQAVTDELTGLPNRRAWYQQLDLAIARARRSDGPLSILMLDLDEFKQVNDHEGHSAGDRLLKVVSSCWVRELRATDMIGRVGGDEFAVILEQTDEAAALEVIARLDRALIGHQRASAGLAVWDCHEDTATLVARADAHMYKQKKAHATVGATPKAEAQR